MSGSMTAPMGAPGGMPQQGGAPQLPPQVLQMLMQRMQGQQPPMQGGGVPGPAGGAPPMGAGPMQPPPPPQPPQGGLMPSGAQQGTPAQQLASKGRLGDSVVAHLTPGEIEVPPQVQTPQLMAALKAAFAKAGVSPQQFTAGSPASSVNPATGAPEYSLWAALLPILGAVGGSVIPGLGTAMGAGLGGAAGGAAGSLMDGGKGLAPLLAAGLGGAGGYLGAGGLSGAGAATDASKLAANPDLIWNPSNPVGTSALNASTANPFQSLSAATTAAGGAPGASSGFSLSNLPWKAGLSAGAGATLGNMLAPPSGGSGLPPSFGQHMPALNPNFSQLRGSSSATTPSFTGYNPYQAVSGPAPGYNFFPSNPA